MKRIVRAVVVVGLACSMGCVGDLTLNDELPLSEGACEVGSMGVCEGDLVRFCDEDGSEVVTDCGDIGMTCGRSAADGMMGCLGESSPPTDAAKPDLDVPDLGCSDPLEMAVIELTNEIRAVEGLPPLACDTRMALTARHHSYDMCERDYFDHTTPEGESAWARLSDAGVVFDYAGENIALDPETAEDVVALWMTSAGHRENILTSGFDRIGVGLRQCEDGRFLWTQVFAD